MSSFQKDSTETALHDSKYVDATFSWEEECNLQETQQHYRDLVQQNIWLKQQIERKNSNIINCFDCSKFQDCPTAPQDPAPVIHSTELWGIMDRNKYLQNKAQSLKHQLLKQSRSIESIRTSQKWKDRLNCTNKENTCYEDKYIKLLRLRSPLY